MNEAAISEEADMRRQTKKHVKRSGSPRDRFAVTVAGKNVPLLSDIEDGINAASRQTWQFFHDLPLQGALTRGAVGLYTVTVFGVAELASVGLSAYVAYRMFAYGEGRAADRRHPWLTHSFT